MRSTLLVFLLCNLMTLCTARDGRAAGAVPMSPEEAYVRNTYAKLRYGSETGVLVNAVLYQGKRFANSSGPGPNDLAGIERALAEQVSFDLSDFQIGDIAAIAGKEVLALASLTPSESFQITQEAANYALSTAFSTNNTTVTWFSIRWKTNDEAQRDTREVAEKLAHQTLGQLLASAGGGYSRYASFSVHATLQGRSISYRALFLFPRENAQRDVWSIDMAAGSGLIGFANAPLYPGAFLETALREHPAVQSWIDRHTVFSCSSNGPAVCCVPEKNTCGIASNALQKALSVPVDPESREVLRPGRKP